MTGTTSASTACQPGHDDLTPRIFRALYENFDLLTIGVIHIVTPKGTPVFIGDSLGQIARRISDHEHQDPAAPSTDIPSTGDLPARQLPRS
jgi:hypothetical protein